MTQRRVAEPPACLRVNSYSLEEAATVKRLRVYVRPSTSSTGQQAIRGVIYGDAGAAPGPLLVASDDRISWQRSSRLVRPNAPAAREPPAGQVLDRLAAAARPAPHGSARGQCLRQPSGIQSQRLRLRSEQSLRRRVFNRRPGDVALRALYQAGKHP